jgi:hypothetical protein
MALDAALADVDEEMPLHRLDRRNLLEESSVARKPESGKAPPFEAPDAQDDAGGEALPEELQAKAFSGLPTGEDEDEVGLRGNRRARRARPPRARSEGSEPSGAFSPSGGRAKRVPQREASGGGAPGALLEERGEHFKMIAWIS